jgi:hypothetical protein
MPEFEKPIKRSLSIFVFAFRIAVLDNRLSNHKRESSENSHNADYLNYSGFNKAGKRA